MTTARPFRFGVVTAQARSGEEWAARARQIESMGYSTLLMPDGLRYSSLAPLPALAAAAMTTRSLRVGTYVLANDYRNPVLLAKEAATLDVVSDGRFELGIGAGRPGAAEDNRMLGVPFESGGARVAALAESLALIKSLRGQGKGVIFISHNLRDIFEVADEIVVFRHGEMSGARKPSETTHDEIVKLMVGS